MQQRFSRETKDCHIWLDETPDWAVVDPVGTVSGYWRNPGPSRLSEPRSVVWGFRVGHGGKSSSGVLGATFTPHSYRDLRTSVPATIDQGRACPKPFNGFTVDLPHEYVGGVLSGAMHEPMTLGAGHLMFRWAATHRVDSSWEAFRLLAVGVVRLLGAAPGQEVPGDLLPYFGGSLPAQPGGEDSRA
jgi:hypothetical protein